MITLKKNYEFSRVYKRGKYFGGKDLSVIILKNNCQLNRFGITVSKKAFKNSVSRNLYRRRVKEILRTSGFNINQGYDIVFVIKKSEQIPHYREIEKGIEDLLIKANLMNNNEETDNKVN